MPFGAFTPTKLQKFIISFVRKNPLLRSAIRTRTNRLLQKIKPGAIDYELYGWMFRFFPAENTGDRKALLTPDGFDQRECELIAEHLDPGGLFLDIGSNIGIYSFYIAAHRKDAQIIAFEPTPRVFAKLSFNLQINGLTDRVSALNLALSDKKGEMQFNTALESLVLGEPDTVVPTDTLLNVLTEQGVSSVSALKIDVEGAEAYILKPFFAEAHKSLWPQIVVIEHMFPEQWDWNCTEFLEENGYVPVWRGKMNTVYKLKRK
tara:strand:- start:359 stop:1144 length:786 start_codon:yes stop_codon:yes gene_type:complete